MEYHTNLNLLLKPIEDDIQAMNWLLSDLDYYPHNIANLPVDFKHDYFLLNAKKFKNLVEADPQIIWGVLIGIPDNFIIEVNEDLLPYSEGNDLIWKNGNMQHPNAQIEIVCFDSSFTIVKFGEKQLSDKFKAYFDEAIELEKFNG